MFGYITIHTHCHISVFPPCVCSYESACEEYLKALDLLRSSEEPDIGPVQKGYISNFIVNRVRTVVCIHYSNVEGI